MSLEQIVDNTRADKNTIHSYLPLYEQLLNSKKENAKNILEIGVYNGGNIKLWSDYFTHTHTHTHFHSLSRVCCAGQDNPDMGLASQDRGYESLYTCARTGICILYIFLLNLQYIYIYI